MSRAPLEQASRPANTQLVETTTPLLQTQFALTAAGKHGQVEGSRMNPAEQGCRQLPAQQSPVQHTPAQQFWPLWQQARPLALRQGVALLQTRTCVEVSVGAPWHERQSSQALVHDSKA